MWTNFFEAGGWGMYPTAVIGFFMVAAAVLLVLRPEARFVPPVVGLSLATLGSGALSTCVGFITTFRYLYQVPAQRQLAIATAGMGESLHNAVLALLLVVPTMLIVTLAAIRAARAAAAASKQA